MPQQHPLPQLTVKAILLGIFLAMVLAGANAYLGLFAGLTVSASIPAAVISMGLLRLFRESNILENNIVQTAASAGESLAAGVIFTLPALVLLGYWDGFDYWWVTAIAGIGGLLGVLFTIPLRRSMIVERQLAYPEGQATAAVLRSGDAGGKGLRLLSFAAIAGGLFKFLESGLRLWGGTAQAGTFAGAAPWYVGTNLSPALLSVGYIVRLNIAVLVFAGGAIAWYVAIPLYGYLAPPDDPILAANAGASATDLAYAIWSARVRYIGVGAMLIGGIWTLIALRRSLFAGVTSGLDQMRDRKARAELAHTEQDAPMLYVLIAIGLFIIPIFVLYQIVSQTYLVSVPMALIMLTTGFLFSSVAAYMAGLVGSSNNPISGITIATITFTALLLTVLLQGDQTIGPPAAILVGSVVCCAAAIAGDNLQDLKAGYILGATPWRQQVMQGVGTISSALVMAPILGLLLNAYGFGPPTEAQPDSLTAPQATLMASVARGVFGGDLPWDMIGIGALIGAAVIALDLFLEKRKSDFRTPVLAVAVGIYLPLELSVPIFLGGLISWLSERAEGQTDGPGRRNGVLLAAGLITGEALMGIFLAIPIVLADGANPLDLGLGEPFVWLGLMGLGAFCVWLYRAALPPTPTTTT